MKVTNEPRSRFEQMNSKRSTKKYSYCFFDYLYYRLYVTYKKHNDPPRFSACCVFAAILLKYKGNKWNRIIPSWVIYTFPIWGVLTGIGICMLIFN